MQFVSWVSWKEFGQHTMSFVFAGILVKTCWDAFCVLAGMGGVSQHILWCFLWSRLHGWAWSTQVKMNFESSLALDEFRRYRLSCIFCSCCFGRGLLNTCWDAFCVLAGMGGVWSTHDEMHFKSLLALDELGQYMLRCILCPGWHGRRLLHTCFDASCVLAGIVGFGKYISRCILSRR